MTHLFLLLYQVFSRGKVNNKKVEEEDYSAAANVPFSAGLLEVALPISFKLKNIEMTEEASSNKRIDGSSSNAYKPSESSSVGKTATANSHETGDSSGTDSVAYYQRFQRMDANGTRYLSVDNKNNSVAASSQQPAAAADIVMPPPSSSSRADMSWRISDKSGSQSGGPDGQYSGLKRSQRSNDEYLMDKFKKVCY